MIYATCMDCLNRVAVDEEQTTIGVNGAECQCVGDDRCKGDLTEDQRLDSPTHEPYSNLRG